VPAGFSSSRTSENGRTEADPSAFRIPISDFKILSLLSSCMKLRQDLQDYQDYVGLV
jgi:hypothetical protein